MEIVQQEKKYLQKDRATLVSRSSWSPDGSLIAAASSVCDNRKFCAAVYHRDFSSSQVFAGHKSGITAAVCLCIIESLFLQGIFTKHVRRFHGQIFCSLCGCQR